MKICNTCKTEKELTEFSKSKKHKDGYLNKCRECTNEYNRLNYEKNLEKRRQQYKKLYDVNRDDILEKKKLYRKENKERLSTKNKPQEWKDNQSEYIKSYYRENKERILEQTKEYRENNKEELKEYRENNKERIREKQKEYREKNKDKIKELQKNWVKNNKNKIKEYRKINNDKIKEYNRNYYKKNNYVFAWRTLLKHTISRMDTIKEGFTIDILGYSALELKEHIENLFTTEMSWENYGEWHIDHIKPVCTFDKETPQNIVNELSNLRPLWATSREINGVFYEGNLNRSKY
jgi:DNA repair exonuclease SbcCD ATPase subunit